MAQDKEERTNVQRSLDTKRELIEYVIAFRVKSYLNPDEIEEVGNEFGLDLDEFYFRSQGEGVVEVQAATTQLTKQILALVIESEMALESAM